MDWEEVGGTSCETFINHPAPRRAMEAYPYVAYPYVLSESLDVGSIDKVVVRLRLPYALSNKWHKLMRRILRMDRIDTTDPYVW